LFSEISFEEAFLDQPFGHQHRTEAFSCPFLPPQGHRQLLAADDIIPDQQLTQSPSNYHPLKFFRIGLFYSIVDIITGGQTELDVNLKQIRQAGFKQSEVNAVNGQMQNPIFNLKRKNPVALSHPFGNDAQQAWLNRKRINLNKSPLPLISQGAGQLLLIDIAQLKQNLPQSFL